MNVDFWCAFVTIYISEFSSSFLDWNICHLVVLQVMEDPVVGLGDQVRMMEKLHSLHIYRLIMNYVVVFQYGSALVRTMAICFKFLCQHEENYKLSSASISLDFYLLLRFPLISPCFYSILLNEIESLTSASHLCSPTGIPAF